MTRFDADLDVLRDLLSNYRLRLITPVVALFENFIAFVFIVGLTNVQRYATWRAAYILSFGIGFATSAVLNVIAMLHESAFASAINRDALLQTNRVVAFALIWVLSLANAELPSWFYLLYGSSRLVPLVKAEAREPGGDPDARPVAVGLASAYRAS